MIQLSRILLPTDFSERGAEATKYACALAEQFDAELHLVHVLPNPDIAMFDFGISPELGDRIRMAKETAVKELEGVPEPAWAEGRRVIRKVLEGTAFVEIIRYAREHDVDLIVLGTHGRSGLAHVLLGSVAERVVRKAPCPVLTVRPEGHQFVMP
jgi:nucleotide-binding universal stress UspA family protein